MPEMFKAFRWRWMAIAVFSVAIIVSLSIFVLPTHVARWFLDSKLEELGLQGSGTETVDIDLWQSEIRFGPLTIGMPGGTPARLERFGLKYSVSRLFDRRGLGKDMAVEGLVLEVDRDETGRITVNGIDVFELLKTIDTEPAADADTENAWGVGLRQFVLRDSRVLFRRHDGGELVMEIDRLTMDGFQSWTPDAPGQFALAASLNGIALEVEGDAKPFSDRIEARAISEWSAVDWAKIQRFTGPLSLTNGNGTLQASLEHEVHLAPDGTIEVSNAGRISVDRLSVSMPEVPGLRFAKAVIVLDTVQTFRPDQRIDLTGSLKVEGRQARLTRPDGIGVDLERAVLRIDDMKLSTVAARRLNGNLSLGLQAAEGYAQHDDRSLRFGALAFDVAVSDLSVESSGAGRAKLSGVLILDGPVIDGSLQGQAERAALRAVRAEIAHGEGTFAVTSGVSLDLSGVTAAMDSGTVRPEFSLKLDALAVSDGRVELKTVTAEPVSWRGEFDLKLRNASVAATGRYSGSAGFDSLRVESGTIDESLRAAYSALHIDGFALSGDDFPSAPMRTAKFSFDTLRSTSGRFDRTAQSEVEVLALDGLSVEAGGLPALPGLGTDEGHLTARAGQLRFGNVSMDAGGRLSFDAISVATVESEIHGEPGAALRLKQLRVDNGAMGAEGALTFDSLSLDTIEGERRGDSGARARIGQFRVSKGAKDAEGAVSFDALSMAAFDVEIPGEPGVDSRFEAMRVQKFTLSPERNARLEATTLSGIELVVGGGEALTLKIGKIFLDRAVGSATPSLEIAAAEVQGLNAAVSSALLPDERPAEKEAAPAAETPSGRLPELSIGRFRLADAAHLVVSDKRQSPAVAVNAKINRLDLENFTTVSPETKSTVAIDATLNEFTDLSAEGWFNLAQARPDVELQSTLKNLELPTFSRYAATHLGVNLESGRLSAEASGKVVAGQLDATTSLNLLNLRFSPLSPEDAKRLSAAAGVPIETAVGLLEDGDGKIELSIPVKGDLENPDFDLDQVVGKAVGNAIVATVGTTLKVLFPPALLLSVFDAAVEGSGVQFAPAPFDAGTTALQPKARDLVEAVAKLLKQRPQLTVTLCGRATGDDLKAILQPEVDAIVTNRRAAYRRDLESYRERLRPFIEAGTVDAKGKPLTQKPPKTLPAVPEQPEIDAAAILAARAAERADELRDKLTALAADRTKVIRRELADRLNVAQKQVAECRPLFELEDTALPRAIFKL